MAIQTTWDNVDNDGARQCGLLSELYRLAEASETGDFLFAIDACGLSSEEAEAARLFNKAFENYKESVEYEIMKYRLTSDALGIGLWDMDIVLGDPINPANSITWSPEFRGMLGYGDVEEFPNVMHSWIDRLHPHDREKAFDAFLAHVDDYSGATPYNVEYRLMLKNGTYRNFHAYGTTLRNAAGVPLRVAGALMDITEKKQMIDREHKLEMQKEAALAANEAKSMFLASMSHEIRTPMNAILGMSDLLLQEKLNKRQFGYVNDIKTAAAALLDIINDILDISKIQAGKLSLVPVHYYLGAMLDNLASVMKLLVDDKGIAFKLDVRGDIPVCLYGDDIRVRQVLLNLLSNAVKFTERGYVHLLVEATADSVHFTVTDSGIGIREQDIPKLYVDFEQFDTHKNRSKKGTGLGLPISRALVEIMGGTIEVESIYGQGSSFHVEIPLVAGDETKVAYSDDNAVPIYAPEARVLVVDDNAMNLNVATGLLRLYKIAAETASSGEQAIEMLKNKQYDIIFMDHMMPGMDGVETSRAIRGMGIGGAIIAFTANATTGAKEILLDAGMDDYLTKPISRKDLTSMLDKWLPQAKKMAPFREAEVGAGSKDSLDAGSIDSLVAGRIDSLDTDNGGGDGGDVGGDEVFWAKIGLIGEMSVSTGLDRVDGQKDEFKKILRLMINEIEKSSGNLVRFFDAGDMKNFCIEAHCIKSSLANIGAIDLAGKAQELEDASAKGDIGSCAPALQPFLGAIGRFGEDLCGAFAVIGQCDRPPAAPPELMPALLGLLSAFADMDIGRIENEASKLGQINIGGPIKDEVEQLLDMVSVMDYDEAAGRIHKMVYKERISG
ncbi:MAG: ATP-binding protein [Oscillospiraceae bacterium]|nr:ATP-binding protein [Oscillospiraceae bacterium]